MSWVLPIKPVWCYFTWNDPLRPLPPVFFSPCTKPLSDHTWNMLSRHPIPSYVATQKRWKRCKSLLERASPCPVRSSPHTTSFILPDSPANPWGPNSHVQDCPWSPGIPHGNHLRLSNPPRATRPRIQVPSTRHRQFAFTIRLSHFGTNCRLRQSTHSRWNLSRHSWMPTGSPCSLKYPSNPPPLTTHSLSTHPPTQKLTP